MGELHVGKGDSHLVHQWRIALVHYCFAQLILHIPNNEDAVFLYNLHHGNEATYFP